MSQFHIHADLHQASPEVEGFLQDLGGYLDPFLACQANPYVPVSHYTFKMTDSRVFKETWERIEHFLDDTNPDWRGYFEAEALFESGTRIQSLAYDPSIPLPFTIIHCNLPAGSFRRNELHIYFNDVRTDERVKQAMRQIGFFPAFCQSENGIEGIWTIQASNIEDIVAIRPSITRFLSTVGGSANCIIDEERVVGYRISHRDVQIAPVIGKINWR
jgi:hypothetical protein